MGDQRYLLTYEDDMGLSYAWFDTEEALIDFVNANSDTITAVEAMYIKEVEYITV